MKKYFMLYTNKYNLTLFTIMAVGLILLFAENGSIEEMVLTKIAAICCAILFSFLFSKWETEGKLTELQNLLKEED